MEALLGECCHIAASEDQMIRPDVLQRIRALLTEANSMLSASMLRDLERGTVTEADHVLGDLLHRQSELAVISPSLLRIAYLNLNNVAAAGAPCRAQIPGEKSHETVLGSSRVLALFRDRTGDACGLRPLVDHGLAFETRLSRT